MSKHKERSFCCDQPPTRLLQWERAHHLDGTDKASQGTADAAGIHEGEPPLGYSRVIRCMNSTQVNPINEPAHTHYWTALRKEGWVGSPTATLPPLGGSPPSPHQHSDQPITGKIICNGTFTSWRLDQGFGLRQHSGDSFSHCHRLICIASYSQQG